MLKTKSLHARIALSTHARIAPVALLLLLVVNAAAQTTTPPTAQDVAARVDEYANALVKQNRFSGAILVARDGKVLLSKGYGMANFEFDVPNTPQTKFRLGSITKQFTAVAVMMLQEQGKLSVQDSVCKYVAECPAAWQPVTVHHLLSHTSGISNFTNSPDYLKPGSMRMPTTVAENIARFKNLPLDFAPGARFNYSNSGYILLGHIIEKVSGKTYEAFLRESIFEPLKMTGTGYDDPAQVLKNRASGYSLHGDKLVNASYLDMTIPHAAGALYSTVEDLYLWDQALYGEKLVSKKSLDAMLTPVRSGYGYGLGVGKKFSLRHISHGGGINGFTTFLERFPDERTTVIVLNNIENANPQQIASHVARAALADKIVTPQAAKVDPSVLKTYVGRYEVDPSFMPNFVLDITMEGDSLYIKPSHQERHKLGAVSEKEFFDADEIGDARYVFHKDDKGNVVGLDTIGMAEMTIKARRLDLPPPSLTGNTTFKLKGHTDAKVVAVAGTFNEWNQSKTLCARDADEWVCRVDLAPGKHFYKFVIDGNWILDPANPNSENDGRGNINSVLVKAQ